MVTLLVQVEDEATLPPVDSSSAGEQSGSRPDPSLRESVTLAGRLQLAHANRAFPKQMNILPPDSKHSYAPWAPAFCFPLTDGFRYK